MRGVRFSAFTEAIDEGDDAIFIHIDSSCCSICGRRGGVSCRLRLAGATACVSLYQCGGCLLISRGTES